MFWFSLFLKGKLIFKRNMQKTSSNFENNKHLHFWGLFICLSDQKKHLNFMLFLPNNLFLISCLKCSFYFWCQHLPNRSNEGLLFFLLPVFTFIFDLPWNCSLNSNFETIYPNYSCLDFDLSVFLVFRLIFRFLICTWFVSLFLFAFWSQNQFQLFLILFLTNFFGGR